MIVFLRMSNHYCLLACASAFRMCKMKSKPKEKKKQNEKASTVSAKADKISGIIH